MAKKARELVVQEHIDRPEAEFKAKEQKLEELRAQLLNEGTSAPVKLPPQSIPNPELEAKIRQAEMEASDALERYEEALNQRDRAPGT